MARRPAHFSTETKLWHPAEGWRVFPAGESDPGAAWSETEGGHTPGAMTTASAMKDLLAATDQIELLRANLATQAASMDALSGELQAAKVAMSSHEQVVADLTKAKDEAEAHLAEAAKARDTAADRAGKADGENADLRREIASLRKDRDDLTAQVETLTAPAKSKAKAGVE